MSTTSDKIDELDQRVTQIEINSAKIDERLSALVSSTSNLKWALWSITLLLLLTVIYGAIGYRGFNQVANAHADMSKPVIYSKTNVCN